MHVGLGHEVTESREVGVPQVKDGGTRIERVAVSLRATVHGKVLGACYSLEIVRVVAFQTTNHRHTHLSCQVRVFSIGLLSASPTWVTEDVDVGRPVGQATVLGHSLSALQRLIEEGTAF